MNLRLVPFQAVGLASVSLIEPGATCPSYVRCLTAGRRDEPSLFE